MTATVASEYGRIRKEHPWLPSKQAVLWARGNLKPLELEWNTFEGRHFAVGRGKRDGFDIRVEVEYSDYTQTAAVPTSENTGIRNPDAVRRYQGEDAGRFPRYIELESGYDVASLAADYRKRGEARGVAWYNAQQSLQEEAEQYLSDDYVMLDYTAIASIDGVDLGEGLIMSDLFVDYGTLERDLDNTVAETDIIEQAIAEAREKARELREALSGV